MTGKDKEIVLKARGLSKMFKVYAHPRDLFMEAVFGRESHRPNWALKDISFDLYRGDILGVVGSNGAGKSTLLKLIVGTLDKTAGTVETEGKISAILEIGTSFNPEFSGRENVRLALIYAGLSGKEIEEKMSDVIAFSELGSVIDNPFKSYSTGMRARLTYSTAISTTTDLIIIDEALAAGDANFLAKALRHLKELCSQKHVSAIFVSHSMPTLMQLCNRGIYLREGEVVQDGSMEEIAQIYEKTILWDDEKLLHEKRQVVDTESQSLPGGSEFHIGDIRIGKNGEAAEFLHVGEDVEIIIPYTSMRDFGKVWVGLQINSLGDGSYVAAISNRNCRSGSMSRQNEVLVEIKKGEGVLRFKLSPLLLGAGGYSLNFLLFDYEDWLQGHILPSDAILYKRYAGSFRVKDLDAFAFENQILVQLPHTVSQSPSHPPKE